MIRKPIFQNVLPASKSDYVVQRKRNGFYKSEPSTRKVDFDGLEAVDVAQNGTLVQLGPSTLEKLLHVKVLDPSDLSYKQEGRPQRTIMKEINLGQSSLDLKSELSAIKEALIQNVASDNHGIKALTLALNNVLNRPKIASEISRQELLNVIIPAIQELDLPSGKQYSKVLDNRFFTRQMYNASRGLINIFLLNNRPSETPVIIMRTVDEAGQLAPLSYLENSWNDARILDVETGTLMPPSLANSMIKNNALDKDIKGQVGPNGRILFPENYDPNTVPAYHAPVNFQGNVNLLPLPPMPNAPPAPPAPANAPRPPSAPSAPKSPTAGPSTAGPAMGSLAEEASKKASQRVTIIAETLILNKLLQPTSHITTKKIINFFAEDPNADLNSFITKFNVKKNYKNLSRTDANEVNLQFKAHKDIYGQSGSGYNLNMTRDRASRSGKHGGSWLQNAKNEQNKQYANQQAQISQFNAFSKTLPNRFSGTGRYSIGDYRNPLKLMY